MNPLTPGSLWNNLRQVKKKLPNSGNENELYNKNTVFEARIVTLIMQPLLLCLNYLSLRIWRALLNSYIPVYLKKESFIHLIKLFFFIMWDCSIIILSLPLLTSPFFFLPSPARYIGRKLIFLQPHNLAKAN